MQVKPTTKYVPDDCLGDLAEEFKRTAERATTPQIRDELIALAEWIEELAAQQTVATEIYHQLERRSLDANPRHGGRPRGGAAPAKSVIRRTGK
jgi:hypothetical protein